MAFKFPHIHCGVKKCTSSVEMLTQVSLQTFSPATMTTVISSMSIPQLPLGVLDKIDGRLSVIPRAGSSPTSSLPVKKALRVQVRMMTSPWQLFGI